jgi:DNA-binding NarL/FixJ family response regulator
VEHHVAGVYAKLGVGSRVELLLRLHDEPWLLQECVPVAESKN